MSDLRPRRSALYLPASNDRALEKSRTLAVDAVVLDLEDAVAPDDKPAAREKACAAVRSGGFGRREVVVRVNGSGTPWHDDDLAAVCAAGPDAVAVPKVESAEHVRDLVAALERHGAPATTSLWAMVETPGAVLRAAEIAAASERLTVLVLGANDLVKELQARHVPGRAPLVASMGLLVLGARAAGKVVLDAVYNDVRDDEGFRAQCAQGRDLGFDGTTIIHPGQVAGANETYGPSEAEVTVARELVAAWEAAGTGVMTFRGRMVEGLHVEQARRVLALAAAIEG